MSLPIVVRGDAWLHWSRAATAISTNIILGTSKEKKSNSAV